MSWILLNNKIYLRKMMKKNSLWEMQVKYHKISF